MLRENSDIKFVSNLRTEDFVWGSCLMFTLCKHCDVIFVKIDFSKTMKSMIMIAIFFIRAFIKIIAI